MASGYDGWIARVSQSFPRGTILGLNYSGMHDTAVAAVAPDGRVLAACSLERISRVKADGRRPEPLFDAIDLSCVECVAVSTNERFAPPDSSESVLHPAPLSEDRSPWVNEHHAAFAEVLARIPVAKRYVDHQRAHAASAYYLSGFADATCLTYDGGMCNSPWFGGLYDATHAGGIVAKDEFAAARYAKIVVLYSYVTALLGFRPNQHEGKITGLAAYGRPDERCVELMISLLSDRYVEIESRARWLFAYSEELSPRAVYEGASALAVGVDLLRFTPETIAASVQYVTEQHVIEILRRAKERGWLRRRICLAGGLFSNICLNRRVLDFGFDDIFVAPPMTDDGTALGAALEIVSRKSDVAFAVVHHPCWGPELDGAEALAALTKLGVRHEGLIVDAAAAIARELADGKIVALCHGPAEFGPRALGNRSILCPAVDGAAKERLNVVLARTDFMPFGPVTRVEDAQRAYGDVSRCMRAAELMTITLTCIDSFRERVPGVVHVDGSARPQLVAAEVHPLLHRILTFYHEMTGCEALINTSFNIHEEPIVCSAEDALRTFFVVGIDMLYLGGYLVRQECNRAVALAMTRAALRSREADAAGRAALDLYAREAMRDKEELRAKEAVIQTLHTAAQERLAVIGVLQGEIDMLRRTAQERLELIESYAIP